MPLDRAQRRRIAELDRLIATLTTTRLDAPPDQRDCLTARIDLLLDERNAVRAQIPAQRRPH